MVGKVLVWVDVETVTGRLQVTPWFFEYAYRMATPRVATPLESMPWPSPQSTYTLPSESTLMGAKLYSVSKALPVLPVWEMLE